MKRLFAVLLFGILLISSLSVYSFAAEKSGWYTSVQINDEYVSLIKNEYYEKYCDYLFEIAYDDYNLQVKRYAEINTVINPDDSLMSADKYFAEKIHIFFNSDSIEKIGHSLYNEMRTSNDIYYLNVYLNYKDDFSSEKNIEILDSIMAIEEVLYAGSTTPCAIVSVIGTNIDEFLCNEDIEFVNYAFSSIGYEPSSIIPESGNRTFNPNAAYARMILRYAAGLYDLSDLKYHSEIKEFFVLGDSNLDGKITAADARTALRIAAGLENGKTYTVNTDSFWSY